jgi:inner membrane protein
VDNVCHTLVGAAFGEAGLKTRTRFGNGALMVAANLPDIDVLVFTTGTPAVSFRRGWTHGVLAQALLPLALTAVLLLWDRLRPSSDSRVPPARVGALLLISYVGVLSHVFLDLLNNYGVRLLMPFSDRWFYGDTLFIGDIWMWLILGLGVYWSRRRATVRPARQALAIAGVYVLVMMVSAAAARTIVRDTWTREHGAAPAKLMVGPLPVTPFSKVVIVDAGDRYETGTFSWLGPRVLMDGRFANLAGTAPVKAAQDDPYLQALLRWSRFPYFDVAPAPGGSAVTFTDLRFGRLVGRTTVFVTTP